MQIIRINVNKNNINLMDIKNIYSDSYNYNRCVFEFDENWNDYNDKIANFILNDKVYSQPIIDNQCSIPIDVLKIGRFSIGIYGNKLTDEKLIERNTTNLITLEVLKGGYFKDSLNISEDDIKIYEIYISKMNKIYLDVKSEHETAINNIDNKEKDAEKDIAKYVQEKIEEYNENAHFKKEEIEKISEEVKKTKTDIEEISEEVRLLEQNAKTSENNAKISEQNAQNSLNKAVEVETKVINIQKDIKASKTHVDNQKESIDNSVLEVEKLVEEATNQANISKQQAELSSKNANQTSADKTETKAIKDEVSTIKTSVEQTKNETEQIKTDTQTIFDNTVQAKEETLKAKKNVENSLENERIASDKKYAKTIDTDEIEVSEFGEVELDEGSYMKDVEISTAKDITQDTRAGYNKLNLEKYAYNEAQSILNGSTVALNNGILSIDATNATAEVTVKSKSFAGSDRDVLVPGKYYFGVHTNGYYESNPNQLVQLFQGVVEITENYYLSQWYTTCKAKEKIDKRLLLSDDVSKTEYEQFGATPSFEFPSEFKNIESNIKINNHQSNCLNNQIKSQTLNGVKLELNEDGSVHISGTATARTEPHIWDKASSNDELVLKKGKEYFNYTGRALYFNVRKNTYLTIPNNKSYIPDEDLSIEYYVYIRIEKDEVVDETIYPFLTTQKDSKYEEFNGNLKKVELGNNFLGSFKGYKNYIKSNKLYANLKILEFDGTENWVMPYGVGMFGLEDNSVNFKVADKQAISNCFKFKNIDINLYNSLKNYEFALQYSNNIKKIFFKCTDFSSVNDWKAKLNEMYNSGNPLKVLYVSLNVVEEDVQELDNLSVFNGINNIDTNNLKLKFKSNRNLENYIDDQIKLNSTEEIKKYDSRYAKALKIKVEDVEQLEIFSEEKSVEELKIKSSESIQENREGYNLVDFSNPTAVSTNTTYKFKNDAVYVSSESGLFRSAYFNITNLIKSNPSKILSFLFETVDFKDGLNACVQLNVTYNDDTATAYYQLLLTNTIKKTYTIPDDISNIKSVALGIYCNNSNVNKSTSISITKPMLIFGNEEKSYERYGITPSIQFPAEIEPKHPNIEISNEEESVHINLNAELYGIKDFKDEIVRNKLIKYIKNLELTGTEEILKSSRDNLFYIQLENIICTSNVNIKSGLILSNCFKNESYTDLRNYTKDYGIEVYLNRIYFRILDFNTVEEVKNKLKELYDSNNAVKIYYILSDPETFELTEEQKQQLDKFKLFDGANNILIENGTLSFKYNKSIQKVLEEKDDKINDLQNQIDDIKALLNTTNTSALLLSNLENDLESEVK
mgnify:CR=1 FL=1